MKKTVNTLTIRTETFHINEVLRYDIVYHNNKEKNRNLRYLGGRIGDYSVVPIYKEDISLLKETNPCWGINGSYDWLKGDALPEPEALDISKVLLVQMGTHSFYGLDRKYLTYVHHGDYIDAGLRSKYYDLDKLEEYLKNDSRVVKISRHKIPYYNTDDDDYPNEEYLDILVLVPGEVWQKGFDLKLNRTETVFGRHYDDNMFDFLGIKQFVIRKTV